MCFCLGLCGSDALVYSALCALCHKSGSWKTDYAFLAVYSCVGNRTTACRTVGRLVGKGLVVIEDGEVRVCAGGVRGDVQIAQNTPYIKESYNINNGGGAAGTPTCTTTLFKEDVFFEEWWGVYTGGGRWQGLRLQTKKDWDSLSPADRVQAMKHTRLFAAGNLAKKSPKRPNWYLLDRVWEEPVGTDMPPVFLSGLEQDECRRSGIAMVQVRAPDGLFRIMRKDEAGRCGMEIVRDW